MDTPFVFLDTTEFISNSFNFRNQKLSTLREKAQNGTINILTTDVVYREAVNRIGIYAKEGYSEIEKLFNSNKIRTIRHLPIVEQLAKINAETLTTASVKELNEFLRQANVEVLSTDNVTAGRILELYFEKLPPFGEGKKKSEFPDAISLVALENWCNQNNESVYVVSKDGDVNALASLTSAFIQVQELGKFLEIVTEHEQQKDLAVFIHNFTDRFQSQITEDIARIFAENHELVCNDYNADAEVSNLEVKNVNILSSYVINADELGLTLDVNVDITFSADIEHQDYNSAFYDKEDDRYIFVDTLKYPFEYEIQLEGTIEYVFNNLVPQEWNDVRLESASLKPELIEIDLDDINNYS